MHRFLTGFVAVVTAFVFGGDADAKNKGGGAARNHAASGRSHVKPKGHSSGHRAAKPRRPAQPRKAVRPKAQRKPKRNAGGRKVGKRAGGAAKGPRRRANDHARKRPVKRKPSARRPKGKKNKSHVKRPRRPVRPKGNAKRPKRFSSNLVAKYNSPHRYLKHRVGDRNYFRTHAKRFSWRVNGVLKYGWKYPGRYHRHWKFYCYNRYYRKWLFYDEGCRCYFYFCGRCGCYLPVSYSCPVCMDQPDDENVVPACVQTDGAEQPDEPEEPEGPFEE
jgi:hypothetical protein